MSAVGRPTKLTPELVKELCDLLAEGKPIQPSCEKVGIDDSTFRLWRKQAREGKSEALVEFFAAVTRARAEGELYLWGIAASGDAQGYSNGQAKCAQWLLERTFSNRYSQRLNVKLEEGLEVLLADVERVCGSKDCGCFEAILASLVARRDGESEAAGDPAGEGSPVH
jgi:hypothetical protein